MSEISEDGFCAGWINWVDSPHFVAMAQWLEMVAQHNDAGNSGSIVGLPR